MNKKKLKKLTKNLKKLFNFTDTPMRKKLKMIDKWYPGPQNLTNEEILMYGDFDSMHDYQFFVAMMRKSEHKISKKNPEYAEVLTEGGGTAGVL